jgi:hypothetical protein
MCPIQQNLCDSQGKICDYLLFNQLFSRLPWSTDELVRVTDFSLRKPASHASMASTPASPSSPRAVRAAVAHDIDQGSLAPAPFCPTRK